MSNTTDALAKIQDDLAHVRLLLKNFDARLAECTGFSLFASWPRRIKLLAGCVGALAVQVDRLTESVESICKVVQQGNTSKPD